MDRLRMICHWIPVALFWTMCPGILAEGPCRKVVLEGEVNRGAEWKAPLGDGWVLKMVPIAPSGNGYTGWDVVVDREQGGGYPDAVLLGTPPYGSLSEREVGTTFGLRAQDAIAWEPRRFHFLASGKDLARGREFFRTFVAAGSDSRAKREAAEELLRLVGGAAAGQLEVLDAKLVGGVGDPPVFARDWALHLGHVRHSMVQDWAKGGVASPLGELRWMRFAVTLWVPADWKVSPKRGDLVAKCPQ